MQQTGFEHRRLLNNHLSEEGLEMTETHEDDEEDDEDAFLLSNDDDDDEESGNIWSEIVTSWRQHLAAIIVAVIAAIVAFYLQSKIVKVPSYGRRNLSNDQSFSTHKHLKNFQRTGNVSFCDLPSALLGKENLNLMDFRFSESLISSMELHISADHSVSEVIASNSLNTLNEDDAINLEIPDKIRCLRRMQIESKQDFIKGFTYFYQKPSIESIYRVEKMQADSTFGKKRIQEVYVSFTGFAAKFVNLDREAVLLFWDGRRGDDRNLVGEIPPFQSLTTATRPGESFSISPVHDHSTALDRWVLTIDDAVQYYEPKLEYKKLTELETYLLNFQKLTREFAKEYMVHAKRTWLSNFPRQLPVHPMWPASYLGQRHLVDDDLSLEVVSVLPRVLRIDNFLSAEECQALINLSISHGMTASTVYAGGSGDHASRQRHTRSSYNAWLRHNVSDITDAIYRKAARVFQVESVAHANIDDGIDAHQHSLAESLQVIRYKEGEQYAPHHDWVIPPIEHRFQPTRFATLLMYLNDDFDGGETNFPRAVTSNQHDGVSIAPVKGSAVLFYNILPDGNVDDLSQHGSSPVKRGVKYAANLWLWEPHIN